MGSWNSHGGSQTSVTPVPRDLTLSPGAEGTTDMCMHTYIHAEKERERDEREGYRHNYQDQGQWPSTYLVVYHRTVRCSQVFPQQAKGTAGTILHPEVAPRRNPFATMCHTAYFHYGLSALRKPSIQKERKPAIDLGSASIDSPVCFPEGVKNFSYHHGPQCTWVLHGFYFIYQNC